MSQFRVGQKVVCVDAYHHKLAKGRVYGVAGVEACCVAWIRLSGDLFDEADADVPCPYCGVIGEGDGEWYEASAFRPLIEDLTASLASKEVERLVPEAPERVNEPQHA